MVIGCVIVIAPTAIQTNINNILEGTGFEEEIEPVPVFVIIIGIMSIISGVLLFFGGFS